MDSIPNWKHPFVFICGHGPSIGDASSQFLVASLAALYKEQARMSLCGVAQQKRICKRELSREL